MRKIFIILALIPVLAQCQTIVRKKNVIYIVGLSTPVVTAINPIDLGAKNDGTDTTATTNAINDALELAQSEGKDVVLTEGIYSVNDELIMRNNVKFYGSGNVVIESFNEEFALCFDEQNDSTDGINYNIENLTIRGQGGYDPDNYDPNPQNTAIYLQNSINDDTLGTITIKDIDVEKFDGGGIFALVARNIIYENCTVTDCNFVAFTPAGEKINVTNCHADSVAGFMEVPNFDFGTENYFSMSNCTAEFMYIYGMRTYGADSVYINNVSFMGDTNIALADLRGDCDGLIFKSDTQGIRTGMGNMYVENVDIEHFVFGVRMLETAPITGDIEGIYCDGLNISDIYNAGFRCIMPDTLSVDTMNIKNSTIVDFNNNDAFVDGSGIQIQYCNNNLFNDNTIQSSNLTSKSMSIPITINNGDNTLIKDNDFTHPTLSNLNIWYRASTNITTSGNINFGILFEY